MRKKPNKPEPPAKNPDNLSLCHQQGKTTEEALASYALDPAYNGTVTVKAYAKRTWDAAQLHLTELAAALDEQAKAAKAGDLSQGEGILMVQAHTLDAIFNNLAQRAATSQYMPQLEQYMRLALKAQSGLAPIQWTDIRLNSSGGMDLPGRVIHRAAAGPSQARGERLCG